MIEIRYAHPGGADVSGSRSDMALLHDRIHEFLKSKAEKLIIEADTSISPWPYERISKRLILMKGEGPTRVSITEDDLTIMGGIDDLDVFASYLDFAPDAKDGYHMHYEYFEGDDRITPDSVPLVLSIRDQ